MSDDQSRQKQEHLKQGCHPCTPSTVHMWHTNCVYGTPDTLMKFNFLNRPTFYSNLTLEAVKLTFIFYGTLNPLKGFELDTPDLNHSVFQN